MLLGSGPTTPEALAAHACVVAVVGPAAVLDVQSSFI